MLKLRREQKKLIKIRKVKKAMLNVAHVGKFTSDRTIQEYVDDIWHLEKVKVDMQDMM